MIISKPSCMHFKNRLELINLFADKRKTNLGVELGTYRGYFAKEILKTYSGKLFLIDIWNFIDNNSYLDMTNEQDYIGVYNDCMSNIEGHEDRCFMLRIDGDNASNLFKDESLDFIYIDANHKYDFVKKDIETWFPKVRPGGIVSGHDYLMLDWYNDKNFSPNGKDKSIFGKDGFVGEFGVNPAVDEFCLKNNFKLNKTTDEWFGSWFFIK